MAKEEGIVQTLMSVGSRLEARMSELGNSDISLISPEIFESDPQLSNLVSAGAYILQEIGLYEPPRDPKRRTVNYMQEPHYLAVQISDTATIMRKLEYDDHMNEIMELLSQGNPTGLAIVLDQHNIPHGVNNDEIFAAARSYTRSWFLEKRRKNFDP